MRKLLLTLLLLTFSGIALAGEPIYELVDRLSPGASRHFLFELTDQDSEIDFFEIDQKGRRIWIKGNNNISIATGLNWYLKYYAGIHISWNNPKAYLGDLPKVKTPERRTTDQLIRYNLNFKTFSTTTPFWDWKRWEQEIDIMALHGVNLAMSLTGTTAVWKNTLLKLGYTEQEAQAYIPSPVYQGWFLSGEIEGKDKTISLSSYYKDQIDLGQRIIERYREWGIEPVLAGYSGMIPTNADEKLGLKIIKYSPLVDNRTVAVINPDEPQFQQIVKIYYQELERVFGTANYYAINPYNHSELTKNSPSEIDFNKVGSQIYNGLNNALPHSTWIIQSWGEYPAQQMMDIVPTSRLLVLDSWSDTNPQWGDKESKWSRPNGYEHHDWLYCMWNDFGGDAGLYGNMQKMIEGYYSARTAHSGRNIRGVGVTSEDLGNNAVMYELLYELPWRAEKFTKEEWISTWSVARYGRALPEISEAWQILSNTAYSPPAGKWQMGATESPFCARPSLSVKNVSKTGTTKIYYASGELVKAFELFLQVADKLSYSENYLYDLIDITRQIIADRGSNMLTKMLTEFEGGNRERFKELSTTFLDLILLQDRLLSSRKEFLLGEWIESAMRMGRTVEEREFFRQDARKFITTWGDREISDRGGMRDYNHRQWSGLLRDYYHMRWKYFFDQINASGVLPILTDYYDMELNWVEGDSAYATYTTADAIEMAREVNLFLKRNQ